LGDIVLESVFDSCGSDELQVAFEFVKDLVEQFVLVGLVEGSRLNSL
jgi:hypothetical protein